MKKSICMVVVLVCLACSAVAESRIGPFVSLFTDEGDTAFGGGVQFGTMLGEHIGIDGRLMYLTKDDVSIIPLLCGITGVVPMDKCSLYGSLGGGYFIPRTSDTRSIGGYSSDDLTPDPAFGFYLGGGVRFPASENMELFAEILYLNAKSTKSETTYGYNSYSHYSVGMDLGGLAVNLGIAWKF